MAILQKIWLIFICTCLVLIQGMIMSDYALAQGGLPTRPGSASSGGSSVDNGDDDDDGIILGDITGWLIDQSTGLPGAGLIVMINDIPIRTDASGHFSLTGIADGMYVVDLNLPSEFTPAQPSQVVVVANRGKVEVTLGYYSLSPPSLEPTNSEAPSQMISQAAGQEFANPEASPQVLPETGGAFPYLSGLTLYLSGLLLWTLGWFSFYRGKSNKKCDGQNSRARP